MLIYISITSNKCTELCLAMLTVYLCFTPKRKICLKVHLSVVCLASNKIFSVSLLVGTPSVFYCFIMLDFLCFRS